MTDLLNLHYDGVLLLKNFLEASKKDHRLGPTHISVYMALYGHYINQHFINPVYFRRTEIMKGARVYGLATYHKCIKELHSFGYIEYTPSYDPGKLNRVNIVFAEIH